LKAELAGLKQSLIEKLQSQLSAFARDIVDAIGAAQKFGGFLDRAPGVDRHLEIVAATQK
jgi:hypothetical protein